jgi:glyoxylase-like metal-dependent hydrolase (beta-lactamase superfamily II)
MKTSRGTLVEIINCGNFLLDGGSMFGRVPRTMWEKWFPPDEKNRILMATNILRISTKNETILVDAGLGTAYGKQDRVILGLNETHGNPVTDAVDRLICTHLHFDHVGGIQDLVLKKDAVISKNEWKDAQVNHPLIRGSYRKMDLDLMADRLCLVEPPCSLSESIKLIPTPGHTRGHVSVLIDDEIFYPGDLIPTAAHVHLPCIMSYDLYPLQIIETKKEILHESVKGRWKLVFEHDPYRPVCTVEIKNRNFIAVEAPFL